MKIKMCTAGEKSVIGGEAGHMTLVMLLSPIFSFYFLVLCFFLAPIWKDLLLHRGNL